VLKIAMAPLRRSVVLVACLSTALGFQRAAQSPRAALRAQASVADLLAESVDVAGGGAEPRSAVVAALAAKTAETRAGAAGVLPYDDDAGCERWLLRFVDGDAVDVDDAAARVATSCAWRATEGRAICEAARDAVLSATSNPDLRWDNAPVSAAAPRGAQIAPWLPAGKLMTMRNTNGDGLVYSVRAGLIDDTGLMADVAEADLEAWFLYAKAVNERVAAALTARTGELAKVVTVNDLSGVDLFGDASFRNALSAASKRGDAIFPGLSGPSVLLNLPRLLGALVKLFTPLFPPAVRAKLKFDRFDLGPEDSLNTADGKAALLAYLDRTL